LKSEVIAKEVKSLSKMAAKNLYANNLNS
ncbi:hypothetical protein SOVF_150700, partial [Spinacia oleracea]